MSGAAVYTPEIIEATPQNATQKRLAGLGFRGFWVESSGKTIINGYRVARYLLTVMPSGYIKCPCFAGKKSKPCCHKQALEQHLFEQEQADAERRAEAMRRETQVEIERESAKRVAAGQAPHPYSKAATALPAYATQPEPTSVDGYPPYLFKAAS